MTGKTLLVVVLVLMLTVLWQVECDKKGTKNKKSGSSRSKWSKSGSSKKSSESSSVPATTSEKSFPCGDDWAKKCDAECPRRPGYTTTCIYTKTASLKHEERMLFHDKWNVGSPQERVKIGKKKNGNSKKPPPALGKCICRENKVPDDEEKMLEKSVFPCTKQTSKRQCAKECKRETGYRFITCDFLTFEELKQGNIPVGSGHNQDATGACFCVREEMGSGR